MTKRLTALIVACLIASQAAVAFAEPSLKVGDAAPPLAFDTWFKGEEVSQMKKGEVYIIECWATWCGPCIAAIPHVTELQHKYADKNVTVIGVCVWDAADDAKVKAFVDKQGDKMGYRVTREHREDPSERAGSMAETWLKAAGRNGIPCSFVVDKEGKIAWIGHPMRMAGPLEKIVAGTVDAKKEAELDAKVTELQNEFSAAARAQEWDNALAALDKLAEVRPDEASNFAGARLNVLAMKGDAEAAKKYATKMIEDAKEKDDARSLVAVASILGRPGAARDLELAFKAAEKAVKLTERKDGYALRTLAVVHMQKEEKDKAVALYEEAIKVADSDSLKTYLQRELDKLKAE